jgi:glycerate kinase
MRILIAPDKFKGSLSARGVADNIAMGLRDELPDAKIDIVPVADGGEGTAEVISEALDGSWVKCGVQDPFGREIECRYAFIDKSKLAIMEMSEAAGMRRLQPNERDIDRANTFGVGEMILNAGQRGAKEIIMGLGGSATNDGGFGMARALGFRFFGDAQTPHLPPTRSYGAKSNPLPFAKGEEKDPRLESHPATGISGVDLFACLENC